MSYLDRLKKSRKVGDDDPNKPKEFNKSNCLVLLGTSPGAFEKSQGMVGQDSPARWWLLHYPDREPVEVDSFPPATHAEILERHPEAIAAEPINQAEVMAALARPIPDDLERLIRRAAAYWQYSPDDLAVIQQAARRDPEGLRLALESDVAFRVP